MEPKIAPAVDVPGPPPMTAKPSGSSGATPKRAPVLASTKASVKLPGCAYHIAMVRANHFTKFAVLAFCCAVILSFVKWYLAKRGEDDIINDALADTAEALGNSVRLQIEGDLAALDGVANLWHLDSTLSRSTFRKYVLSKFYENNLQAMQTVILATRVQPDQREAIETHPTGVQLRRDCCAGTTYDIPSQGVVCRNTAKAQCRIPGPHRYYFTEKTPEGVRLAPYDDGKERMIITYQEPFEVNPGPTGLDFFSIPSRSSAFWEAVDAGSKSMTRRVPRVFYPGQFGMLVWNPLFVDRAADGNKSVIIDGVELSTKESLEEAGKEPFAIAAVLAVYEPQYMLRQVIERVFDRGLHNTRVWLLDERAGTPEAERIIGMWDANLPAARAAEVVQSQSDYTKARLLDGVKHQSHSFRITGMVENMRLSIVVVPNDDYLASLESRNPDYILALSLLVVVVAQLERWIGHPIVISSTKLWRAKMEREIRVELEDKIVAAAASQDPTGAKYEVPRPRESWHEP